jgi:hypothetical protein
MSRRISDADGGRLRACRACGNRVPPATRRCPACGASDPVRPEPARPSRAAVSAGGDRRRRVLVVALGVVVLLAAGVMAAVVVWRPPPAPPLDRRPAVPILRPGPPQETPPPATEAPTPSRSRGRIDWIFFFRPGDRLASMGDEAPVGYVVRTEKAHAFADGTVGPAYVLWTPAGEERSVDADELERSAKLQ